MELPFWYQPNERGMTAERVLSELSSRVVTILGGIQVFRPLVQPTMGDPTRRLSPSTNRGPSTLVFDHQGA